MKSSKGVTLVELLVVIAIIDTLVTGIIVLINPIAQINKAKTAKAKSEIYYIKQAMELFFDDFNDYPPLGADFCNFPTTCTGFGHTWNQMLTILSPKYIKRIERDPWGRPYYFDKNYVIGDTCSNSWSFICSAGPSGIVESDVVQNTICGRPGIIVGDDICVYIEHN